MVKEALELLEHIHRTPYQKIYPPLLQLYLKILSKIVSGVNVNVSCDFR